jgi:transposase
MHKDYVTRLLGIQGFVVERMTIGTEKGRSCVIVDLRRERQEFMCSGCGERVEEAVEYRQRVVQHLSVWEHLSYLRFKPYRVQCPRCGLKVEKLPFIGRYSHVTVRLGHLVYELCKVMTNKAVGILQGLDEGTVKAIDKAQLQEAQENRNLEGISALGVDEIAVGKGQNNYLHVVSARKGPRGAEVIYVGEGRRETDLKPFWQWFGKARTQQIKIAVMDMWKGFLNSLRAHGLGIVILYDKFHVIRHLLNALNKVRNQELRRVNQRIKGLLTGKKFILLSRLAHVRGKAREALNELLCASPRLMKAHLLKESFSHLWSYKSKTWALKFWRAWKDSLRWTRLKPYRRFAKMIDKHLDGILAYCDHKLPLGFIEATNLKAKNIIRRAYGYRDREYMKLKIIQACSSLGVFQPWISPFNNSC